MIDAEILDDLRRSFTAALSPEDPVEARTALLHAGWLESLEADEPVASAIVFRIQGASLHDAAALDDIIGRRLAHLWPDSAGDLAVAYPVPGGPRLGPPGKRVVLAAHRHAQRLLWMDDLTGRGIGIIELEDEMRGSVGAGVDPYFGLLELDQRPPGRLIKPECPDGESPWTEALSAARVALSHQLIAGANATLAIALAYAKSRKQFDTPIGAFQAVKHRLAETLVAISSADAATVAAATTGTATAASVAKVLAGRAASTAARNCLQVLGGIGFTAEHEFHRYLRRGLVLDQLLGDSRRLEEELGRLLRSDAMDADNVVNLWNLPRVDLLSPP